MATKKFAGPSPYTLKATYPPEDYLHTEYVKFSTRNKGANPEAPPVVAALFGLGKAGSIHLSNIVGNARIILKYIVEDRVDIYDEIRKYWNLSKDVILLTSAEANRVYTDKSVNIVLVASPTWTHSEIVVNSIANNKDVFCEKPITESIEKTTKCYETAKAKGRKLYTAFNRRFDPAYRSLKERVRKGEVGHIQILKVVARDSPVPSVDYLKVSGGFCRDSLVHDIDITCWVLGELPIKVQATSSALIPEVKAIGDVDTVAYMFTFPSGAVSLGDNSRYSAYGYDQRLEVFGNKGMIKVENERPCPSTEAYIGHDGVKKTPIFFCFPSRFKQAYKYELEHFLDVVQCGFCRDSLVHDIDITCWVLGQLPIKVQATSSALIPEVKAIGDVDTVAYMFTFPSGAVSLGDNSRHSAYGYDQRLEVFGNKGMIKVENERPCPSTEAYIGHDGVKKTPIFFCFPSRFKQAYKYELDHFLDVVQYDVPMDVTSWQSFAVHKISAATAEAARTGQTVEIDWSKDNMPAVYS